ncbi:MAG TPA: hypothetical protein VF414_17555, partial [Thermoanaerobaculia bacterium]
MIARALACLLLASAPAVGQSAFLVRDINTTRYLTGPYGGVFRDLHAAGDKLFFLGPVNGGGEGEVWVSDGTALGTEALRDVCPGVCDDYQDFLGNLGNLMLWLSSGHGSDQLWRSDGTRSGTFALTDAGVDVGSPLGAIFHGDYFFNACDGGT